jgi:hypothetical protein
MVDWAGGDYCFSPQHAYRQLKIARRDIEIPNFTNWLIAFITAQSLAVGFIG